ncbi:hypothetical protein TUN199_08780 [Pyrenophora tritici-repentis]|nr:hypothetical protein TUN199_08780 [Pyrenophora tritici-repentis]
MEEPGIVQTLSKIREQTSELNKSGLTTSDLKILKKRLVFAWGESGQGESGHTTAWRNNHARERYIRIQDTSAHLFLAVILAIGPTECGLKPFENVHHHLLRLGNYHEFHVDLKPVDKKHLTHLATQAGLSENHRYKTFLQALFPQESTPRH